MRRILLMVGVGVVLGSGGLAAQEPDIGGRLLARGAPAGFAEQVRVLVQSARQEQLPVDPLENKAMEGWAKRGRVGPPERIVAVLEQLRDRLREGRSETEAAGLTPPPGAVVSAAAEALGRGMTSAQVRELIRAAPAPDAAAAGLTVAASLAAQGLEPRAAVQAVQHGYGQGQGPQHLFELPSVVADLIARGVPMSDVARQILEGGGLPLPPMAGEGRGVGRPGNVPPGPDAAGQGRGMGRGKKKQ